MEGSDKTGTQDNAQRVRITWFPKYSELRHLLGVWPGHTKTHVSRLQQTLMGLTGTPQNPVDWKDPDTWIPERLSGEDRELAYAIWTKSGKTVNPRHIAGHWILSEKYALVSERSNGDLELTERGREFVDQPFGKAERLLDQHEGLIELLSIVAGLGPARSGALVEPWGEFLERASRFGSTSTIRDTLRRRLNNLLDRDLVARESLSYSITNAGGDYLKRVRELRASGKNGSFKKVTESLGERDGFGELTRALRDDDLLFSREMVANYVLALQTKRLVILTGISGTGKTKIAVAVAQHFQQIPNDAVEIEVTHSQIEYSRLVLPIAIESHPSISTTVDRGADRAMRVKYPTGHATLSYYWGDKKNKKSRRLLFKEDFKQWFQSTFSEGDRFWLRVLPGETADSGQLQFAQRQTEVVNAHVDNYVVVPVRPDWVDNRGLLGYLNALTDEYSTTPFLNLLLRAREEEQRAEAAGEKPHPFFIILDEMNLARVEPEWQER